MFDHVFKGDRSVEEHSAESYIRWKHWDNLSCNKKQVKLYQILSELRNYSGIKSGKNEMTPEVRHWKTHLWGGTDWNGQKRMAKRRFQPFSV